MTIGRAITGVYNKVMNFRAIDPTDPRAGLSAGGQVEHAVWDEFYDASNGHPHVLEHDFRCVGERYPHLAAHVLVRNVGVVGLHQDQAQAAVGGLTRRAVAPGLR